MAMTEPATKAPISAVKVEKPAQVKVVSVDMSLDQLLPLVFKVLVAAAIVGIGFGIVAAVIYGIYRTYLT